MKRGTLRSLVLATLPVVFNAGLVVAEQYRKANQPPPARRVPIHYSINEVFQPETTWLRTQEPIIDEPLVNAIEPQVTYDSCGEASLGSPEERALLDTLAHFEGAEYDVMFGGATFTNFSSHPVHTREMPSSGITRWGHTATPAGRYQINRPTFDDLQSRVGLLPDFSPEEQDQAALYMIRQALKNEPIASYDLSEVQDRLKGRWSSLRSSSTEEFAQVYASCLSEQQRR
jgi:muramidase (phage lysozyme)